LKSERASKQQQELKGGETGRRNWRRLESSDTTMESRAVLPASLRLSLQQLFLLQ